MSGCELIDPAFTWGRERPLRLPWHEVIAYEMHVRGFSMRHPEVPEAERGTFAGLSSHAVVGYLKDLGITAVELLPVHQHVDQKFLVDQEGNVVKRFAPTVTPEEVAEVVPDYL